MSTSIAICEIKNRKMKIDIKNCICLSIFHITQTLYKGIDSCHIRVIQNQQYLYPKLPPTAVVKLLQYSGSRVELRDGFHLTNYSYHDSKW